MKNSIKLFALSIILVMIACSKQENLKPVTPVTPTDSTRINSPSYKRLMRLMDSSAGIMYRYNDTLGFKDSLLITHNANDSTLQVFSTEFRSSFVMVNDSLDESTGTMYMKVIPFTITMIEYDNSDSIQNAYVHTALISLSKTWISIQFIVNGTYRSQLSPDLDSTYVTNYALPRNYFK